MYSFYYVATGLKDADFVFFIQFCGGGRDLHIKSVPPPPESC